MCGCGLVLRGFKLSGAMGLSRTLQMDPLDAFDPLESSCAVTSLTRLVWGFSCPGSRSIVVVYNMALAKVG